MLELVEVAAKLWQVRKRPALRNNFFSGIYGGKLLLEMLSVSKLDAIYLSPLKITSLKYGQNLVEPLKGHLSFGDGSAYRWVKS
jgi:hypothetical protein